RLRAGGARARPPARARHRPAFLPGLGDRDPGAAGAASAEPPAHLSSPARTAVRAILRQSYADLRIRLPRLRARLRGPGLRLRTCLLPQVRGPRAREAVLDLRRARGITLRATRAGLLRHLRRSARSGRVLAELTEPRMVKQRDLGESLRRFGLSLP